MTRKRAEEAKLVGWKGPIFPPATDAIIGALESQGYGHFTLRDRGREVGGFVKGKSNGPKTTDGYEWYECLLFETGPSGTILVAFPWTNSPMWTKGVTTERAVAFYSRKATAGQVEQVAQHFLATLQRACQHKNERYDPAMHAIYCKDCGLETACGEEREQRGGDGAVTVLIHIRGVLVEIATDRPQPEDTVVEDL